MKEVRWLTEKELHPGLAGKCEAELASDEMDQWESGIKCSKMAEGRPENPANNPS